MSVVDAVSQVVGQTAARCGVNAEEEDGAIGVGVGMVMTRRDGTKEPRSSVVGKVVAVSDAPVAATMTRTRTRRLRQSSSEASLKRGSHAQRNQPDRAEVETRLKSRVVAWKREREQSHRSFPEQTDRIQIQQLQYISKSGISTLLVSESGSGRNPQPQIPTKDESGTQRTQEPSALSDVERLHVVHLQHLFTCAVALRAATGSTLERLSCEFVLTQRHVCVRNRRNPAQPDEPWRWGRQYVAAEEQKDDVDQWGYDVREFDTWGHAADE